MALLKKLKAATLTEIIIASVIILVIFGISSMSLNNIFGGMVRSNDSPFHNRIREIVYFAENEEIQVPFYEETSVWEISVERRENVLVLEALYKPKDSTLTKQIYVVSQ